MSRFVNRTLEEHSTPPDLICLSHLPWDLVYQRPQHLMTRFARDRRVFFVQEPAFHSGSPQLKFEQRQGGIWIVVPYLPRGTKEIELVQAQLIAQLLAEFNVREYILWYYTPMAVPFTRRLHPQLVVYDCMDELALFQGASRTLRALEEELFRRADLVFTGGASLYQAKREQYSNVHLFPSSVDVAHFRQARQSRMDPPDQASIPHPRLGFFGVIDERMDLDLLRELADSRSDWHIVMIGPIAKIEPEHLPRRSNIHYLGTKPYSDLPAYLAGWDVALLPFAQNNATRFISPTKTPEYLAGGKPVVSTPIRDVVVPYGDQGLVQIAATPSEFVAQVQRALDYVRRDGEWLSRVDAFLAQMSWDRTYQKMARLVESSLRAKRHALGPTSARPTSLTSLEE